MKFSLAATAIFALASTSSAASFIQRRASTAVGTVNGSIGTVQATIPTYLSNIQSSVAVIKGEANVYTALAQAAIAAIEGSAGNVTAALNAATLNILGATTTALGDINTRAAILVQSDVDLLAKDLQMVVTIIRGINATVSVVHADLDATANSLVQGEITALTAALQPFVIPVTTFATAAAAFSVTASVTGLRAALNSLITIAGGIYATLGI
ncbi:hypothetical protein Daus18300_013727 [Diaporthe australafricana]|uniref:Uncharacterized protein n=1 Tax=Diaporthe australafricana TaxID=127596 RepID=A0ABR3VXW2_9PEZI